MLLFDKYLTQFPVQKLTREEPMNKTSAITLSLIKRITTLLFAGVAALLIWLPESQALLAQAQQATVGSPAAATQQPAGQDQKSCNDCHEKIVQGFKASAHGKWQPYALNGKNNGIHAEAVTCQACHGNGQEHMENGGDTSLIKNPAKQKAREASQLCMQCHQQMKEHTNWPGSRHETAGLSCLSCHDLHQTPVPQQADNRLFASAQVETKLLRRRSEAETCFQCHADVRKAQFQRSTHLFRNENREHQVTCSSCHEPHGSIGDKMMRTSQVNETCYQCHTEKRGPFLFEHSPVRENCITCHRAHGSNQTALLSARAPMLCQQCHIQGRHQTVAGRPNSSFTFNRACVNCHSQIHGSNHPSGINLQR